MEKFNGRDMVYKLSADRAEWDSIRGRWKLTNYNARTINGLNEHMNRGPRKDTVIPLKPIDFIEDIEEVSIMNYFTLREHIARKVMRGDPDVIKYKVKEYGRFADPFATLILTLIAVSVSSRKVRGGIGFNLGLGLALTFIYILFMQVFTVFATFGNFPPLLAVWIPNILFGIIALFLAQTAPK
jgi:lipopolysaccharide export system permease protein